VEDKSQLLGYATVPATPRASLKPGRELFTGPPGKILKLAILFLFLFLFQIWFQKYYISPHDTQFLINEHKNRGRFLFTGASVKSSLPSFKRLPTLPAQILPLRLRSETSLGAQNMASFITIIIINLHQERISCSSCGKSPNFPMIHSLLKLLGGIFSVTGEYETHGAKNTNFKTDHWEFFWRTVDSERGSG
jgi:hypothetical protein